MAPKQFIHAEQPRVEQVQPSPAAETELADDIDADLQQALERVQQLQKMQQQREEQRNISRMQRPAVATVFDAGVTAGSIGTGGVPPPEKGRPPVPIKQQFSLGPQVFASQQIPKGPPPVFQQPNPNVYSAQSAGVGTTFNGVPPQACYPNPQGVPQSTAGVRCNPSVSKSGVTVPDGGPSPHYVQESHGIWHQDSLAKALLQLKERECAKLEFPDGC